MSRYDELINKKILSIYRKPRVSIPKLTEIDYSIGYIYRYFVQEASTVSAVYEVDIDQYLSYISHPLYKVVKIRWKIIGDANTIRESNYKSIVSVSDVIPNLKNYLLNLTQFMQK